MQQELFENVVNFNQKAVGSDFQALVPVLIGGTGTGKTTRIRKFAEKLGLPVKTLLLGTMLEEEVLGLPRVVDNVTQWSIPEYANTDQPFVLFCDELDKARPSVLSTVLTLFAEQRIRDRVLPKGTIIIAAMQPVSKSEFLADETGRAIVARSCFVSIDTDWNFLNRKYSIDLGFLPMGQKIEAPILPHPAPRQVEWAVNFIQSVLGEEEGENLAKRVLEGVVMPQFIQPLIDAVKNTQTITPEATVKAVKENMGLLEKLTISELIALMPDFWVHGNPDTVVAAWSKILDNGTNEEITAALQSQYTKLAEIADANGGQVEVFGPTTEEEDKETLEKFNAMFTRVGKAWNELAEKQEKDGKKKKA